MPFDPIEDRSSSIESHGKGLIMGEDVEMVGFEDIFGDGEMTPSTTFSVVATAAP
jgi:hypothetical protein